MFNPTTFKLAPLPSWQYPFRLMFSREHGQVNIPYEIGGKFGHWCIPQGSKLPEDWDVIIEGFYLAVSDRGILNVEAGTKDAFNIVSSACEEDDRSLYDCFMIALQHYQFEHNKHHPKLHPSWYDIVNNFVE